MKPTTMDNPSHNVVNMNAIADIEMATDLIGRIESMPPRRGMSAREIRQAIAARLQISPGTLENLRRHRLKIIPNWLMARIRAELAAALRAEAMRIEHEVNLHFQTGGNPGDSDLAKARASLEAIKAALL